MFILQYYKDMNIELIKSKSYQSIIFTFFFVLPFCIGLYLYDLKDYFIKYWLYNSKNDKFYVFE